MVVTLPTNGLVLFDRTGSTSLQDLVPPTFLNCPTSGFIFYAQPGQVSAVATWTVPTVVDNIDADPSLVSSKEPGDSFSVIDSPHTVVYTASDGVQQSTCTFTVTVEYSRYGPTIAAVVAEPFPAVVQTLPQRFVHRVKQSVLSLAGPAELTSLTTASLGANTTEVRLVLTAPPGQPFVARTRPDALSAQIAVTLLYRQSGSGITFNTFPVDTDVGVRIELLNFVPDTGTAVDALTDTERLQTVAAVNRPRTDAAAQAFFSIDAGGFGVVNIFSQPYRRGGRFEALTVVLQLPAGRLQGFNPAAGDLALAPGSAIDFVYDYPLKLVGSLEVLGGVVQLLDTEPPQFQPACPDSPPVLKFPTLAGKNYAQPTWALPTAVDNAPVPLQIVSNYEPGDSFPLLAPWDSPVEVVYTASDAFDNEATCTMLVQVVDDEPPTMTLPSALQLSLPSTLRILQRTVPASSCAPTAAPAQPHSLNLTAQPASGSSFAVGTTRVTAVVFDRSGNYAECSFNVTVVGVSSGASGRSSSSTVVLGGAVAGGGSLVLLIIAGVLLRRARRRSHEPVNSTTFLS